jgi:hypothetical protein
MAFLLGVEFTNVAITFLFLSQNDLLILCIHQTFRECPSPVVESPRRPQPGK